MRTNSNTEYKVTDSFDVRYTNITKLATVTDCEIVIAEAMHCIRAIEADLASNLSGSGDSIWRASASQALADLKHKARMATMKRDALATPAKKHSDSLKMSIALHHFVRLAKAELPPAKFAKCVELAGLKVELADVDLEVAP